MLIHDFLLVPRAFEKVRAAISRDPHAVIDANAAEAYREGALACLQLQPSPEHSHIGKQASVDIGELYDRVDGVVLPMHWWVQGVTPLYPRLDADLEFMPVGEHSTQLTLSGRYDAPLGGLGRGFDPMLFHRLAEGSVRSFLTRLSQTLQGLAVVEPTARVR